MRFRQIISQIGKPVSPREALSNRTSKWVADKFGVSRRTAQRWKKGTQQPSDRLSRKGKVMDSADAETRRKVAADALRGAQAVDAGTVRVRYPGGRGDQTKRKVGVVPLDEQARERMQEAADALERGDVERAEGLVSDAVLNTNGRHYGPLQIDDYPPGFHLI